MKIPEHVISQLNAQADLVAIIKRHTTLKPAGKEFKGCCPFHGEKTPSFFVNPQTNLYYCFGCGAKGNAVSFLVDYERLSFIEAIKELANQTGIELPKDDSQKISYARTHARPKSQPTDNNTAAHLSHSFDEHSHQIHSTPPNNLAATTPQDGNLYQLLQAISSYYQAMLDKHPAAKHYLLERGLSHDSIALFEIGYAPAGWQHLETAFGQDIEGLKMLGLVRTSQKGRDFDLLRDRIIFPIKDRQGQIVGFAGRSLDDAVEPKYINSSDSAVFQKQHILYGYHESRKQRAQDWLIVEGYMDVIALYQAGIYGAVAPMGTAVNQNQLSNLLKFNDSLTLCFDGDAAGQKAALRTLDVAMPILNDGKQLKFLVLPDNHDPDSFVRTHGAEAMRRAIGTALPLSDYLFDVFSQKYDLNQAEQKAAAMAELRNLTDKLPKGSSFRWWLNSDIYNRLKTRNINHTAFTKTTTSGQNLPKVSPSEQLLLCILYYPSLIGNNPLQQLYINAKLDKVDEEFVNKLNPVPALPNWQELHSEGLGELIAATQAVLPFVQTSTDPIDAWQIDANAHLILSGLENPKLQADLAAKWRDFFNHTQHYPPKQVALLFDELLCHAVMVNFREKLKHPQGLILSSLYKKRLIALEDWDKNVIKPAIEATQA